jgi:hypothetical protein
MIKPHFFRVGPKSGEFDATEEIDPQKFRRDIEPWLSALSQAEHLSLLIGNGLTRAIAHVAGVKSADMGTPEFESEFNDILNQHAVKTAESIGRGKANFEDKIRAASQLIIGLEILNDKRVKELISSMNKALKAFVDSILTSEKGILHAIKKAGDEGQVAKDSLESFLLSFSSRLASRERLHIFTTNYDRLVEYGSDIVGLRVLDRFVGGLSPIFRSSRIEVDLHYNPPGIRGEPRYLEGVVKLTKLHGSIDWRFENGNVRRYAIPFGAINDHPDLPLEPFRKVMIYPNPAKDVETLEYPYAELFRDFASSICRPNSVLVTYGYSFGDDHINRVISDMLSIASTHLVIISFDDASGRIPRFCKTVAHEAQISLLLGAHFGNLPTLTEYYLPKPAIDQITWRQAELLRRRDYRPESTEGE